MARRSSVVAASLVLACAGEARADDAAGREDFSPSGAPHARSFATVGYTLW